MLPLSLLAALATAPVVESLTVHPTTLAIPSGDSSPQLVVTGHLPGGKLTDLTGDVEYTIVDPKVVRVTSSGRVIPLRNGQTTVVIRAGSKEVRVPVTTSHIADNLPINFVNQIEPIFSKLSCNSGGCHGKASGQNGFKLSLLGDEPANDYQYIVSEARGRRVFPAAPEQSLLLRKATGQAAHGGGKKMEPTSDEYKLVRRWIASGLPYGKPTDPVVTNITIFPDHRIVPRQSRQQVAVVAHYSDGSSEDITRRAQYESNDPDVAAVDEDGLVRTLSQPGQVGVMARYQGFVAVFRATVPRSDESPKFDFPALTVVDTLTAKKWRELGLKPSEVCTDEQFIRRVTLDITGTLPTPTAIIAFTADRDPKKRAKLVDRLLDTPEYAYYFANKWSDILKVKRRQAVGRAYGTFAFHDWIRQSIADDKPYDQFVREILGAVGDETKNPPTVWYKEVQTPEQFVDDAAQVFLGQRLACAQCHHHPYEKWSQDDYWGLAAFFSRVGRKTLQIPGQPPQTRDQGRQLIYIRSTPDTVRNKRTGQRAEPKLLDGNVVKLTDGTDPRLALADWMADPNNPFFASTVANRYWAHFLGRGIVDPLDDMRVTNPPSNPELLDALAKEVIRSQFSLKHLIRVICNSRTYQLSATPNETNASDKQAYSRYYPKRLSAEVLYDALCQATATPPTFNGLPQDAYAPKRAIMLPDESYTSYFLDVFGRPQRLSACECERVSEANLAQSLHLLNSNEVQDRIANASGRAATLAKDTRSDEEKIDELFLWTVGHKPNPSQKKLALETLAAAEKPADKKAAFENMLWALVNSKAFLFNY